MRKSFPKKSVRLLLSKKTPMRGMRSSVKITPTWAKKSYLFTTNTTKSSHSSTLITRRTLGSSTRRSRKCFVWSVDVFLDTREKLMRSSKPTKRSRHATSRVILTWITLLRKIVGAIAGLIHQSISTSTLAMMKVTTVL